VAGQGHGLMAHSTAASAYAGPTGVAATVTVTASAMEPVDNTYHYHLPFARCP
jgi:hypothetical protein